MNLLRNLWAREPVLVGTLVPVLVTAGFITADQASALTNAIAGAVSLVALLLGAFGVRATVTSPTTLAETPKPPQPGSPFSGGH